MVNAIEIIGVSKIINDYSILSNINLTIPTGEIWGLYGPNGSGKSMLLKMICGLVNVSKGEIRIEGKPVGYKGALPDSMGILIEQPGLLSNLSAYSNLQTLADIKRIANESMIQIALDTVGLSWLDKRPVGKYSLGMRQKVGIAQAIFELPRVVLLDEPTNNLDEESCLRLVENLKNLNKQYNMTICVVSHQKQQLEDLCSRITYIADGKIVG